MNDLERTYDAERDAISRDMYDAAILQIFGYSDYTRDELPYLIALQEALSLINKRAASVVLLCFVFL
jgi:hypothetical protein